MQSVFAGGDMYVRCCCQWQIKHVSVIWHVYISDIADQQGKQHLITVSHFLARHLCSSLSNSGTG